VAVDSFARARGTQSAGSAMPMTRFRFVSGNNQRGTIQETISQHVESGSMLNTDEAGAYDGIKARSFDNETVNHSAGEYVRGSVTTNGIESVFAVFKRGMIGVYHHTSRKHLGRYVDDLSFRLNEGNVKNHTLVRLDSFFDGVAGKRLTYKGLIQRVMQKY
jgi:ISXO2-like transposase domain